jgi:hypothetical protein
MFYFLKKPFGPAHTINLETEIRDEYVYCTVTTGGVFTETPIITVREGTHKQTVQLDPIDVNKYSGSFIPSPSCFGNRSVEVTAEVDGKSVTTNGEFCVYPIPPDTPGSFLFDGGNMVISFDSGAVYKQLCVQIKSVDSKQPAIYLFGPEDVPLDRGLRVTLRAPTPSHNEHWGLYYRGRSGWVFQTADLDSGATTFSTVLNSTLGEVGLFRDDTPPTIGRLRTSVRNGNIALAFRYHDNLSGVDTDEIKLYIDNTLVIPEIDGEHRLVSYSGTEPMQRGKHQLKITVKDRTKNETSITRTFQVR